MSGLFENLLDFDEDINEWRTENVTDMLSMFRNCRNFNFHIEVDTSSVKVMSEMFRECLVFNEMLRQREIQRSENE